MLILAFDVSGPGCAVALVRDGTPLSEHRDAVERGQDARLFPAIEAALAEAGLGWPDLDAVAVCTGPGNFTGARIGVAAARGLALSLAIPAIGVDRFDAAAAGRPGRLCVRLPARGGAAHVARFEGGRQVAAATLQADEIADFVGADEALTPAATDLGRLAALAADRLAAGETARPAPRYLRPVNAAPPREAPPALLP